jgi:excisionase family DNA binding protein
MTGRELIIYILSNNLEDEPIFEDGRFIGFMSLDEAAEKFDVGVATILAWIALGKLDHLMIGAKMYIPADSERPILGE